ncbi:M20/M25/M40 family metallo-hydrolase [Flavisolibacter nicotianae]|uniref:M20/M25/M40 family metallo-hydrolase n=1 Tax=Flavisolibacter nicotianae TaxID=2364882 RepID=UPI00196919C8|nr:M20/M25/M40 family metallo-hydrolase [Flavisolibacter nicotianae]
MKKSVAFFFFASAVWLVPAACMAQKANGHSFTANEVERIESVLASDSMQGRAAGSAGIEKAANFIAAEFQKAGLQPLQGSYLQSFTMVKPRLKELKFKADGADAETRNLVVFTSQPNLEVDEKSGYAVERVGAGENLFAKAMQLTQAKKNTIALVDTSFAKNFSRLAFLKRQMFQSPYSVLFLLGSSLPKEFKVKAEHSFEEMKLFNVVGVLPGKSKKNEQVVFSSHYDHLGIGRPVEGDSIYNGANDDAAGTTAVIMLARHFKQQAANERTLVFAAFTAEEVGGFGSQYFSRQLNPASVAAMFNIEMIGTESKWGKNSAYITGYEKTNMGEILQANLKGSAFTFYPDPYPQQQLFYRSDNATLARQGVPAHTISTAKMEDEPNYHKPSDEVKTLDLQNMAQIISAIAESSKTIVSGKDTPTRVKTEDLR